MANEIVITDIQKARAIIGTVGDSTDNAIMEALRSASCLAEEYDYTKKAMKVVDEIADEHTLKIANRLWSEKFDSMPDWIKEY